MPTGETIPHQVSGVFLSPTILCGVDDGCEAVWSISFVVESFDFDLKRSGRAHGLIFMNVAASIWVSNCHFFPFFPIKWLKCHYVTKIVAVVVFS